MQSFQRQPQAHGQDQAFGKLFPELPPLHVSEELLAQLANKMCEAQHCDDSESFSNGIAIFSQFLAHDITFESTSSLRGLHRTETLQNDRTFNLDLDCVYGQRTQDFYYDAEKKDQMLLGKSYLLPDGTDYWYDLQRNAQQKAIIPDARNDENIIVSRMQVLLIEFHNKVVRQLQEELGREDVFEQARRVVLWHYQWLILHSYLKRIVQPNMFDEIYYDGATFYWESFFLPLEFTGAVFRAGHSQTRTLNRINEDTEKGLFELGHFTKMEEYVDWRYLFDLGDRKVQMAKKIDTHIEPAFANLPFVGSQEAIMNSLPFRNLQRGVVYGLASGEDIAKRMAIRPIDIPETHQLGMTGTPLWYYVLKEAEVLCEGERLGPVGSILLAEVFITIMRKDNRSFLKIDPLWKPHLGRVPGQFDFADLIKYVYPYL